MRERLKGLFTYPSQHLPLHSLLPLSPTAIIVWYDWRRRLLMLIGAEVSSALKQFLELCVSRCSLIVRRRSFQTMSGRCSMSRISNESIGLLPIPTSQDRIRVAPISARTRPAVAERKSFQMLFYINCLAHSEFTLVPRVSEHQHLWLTTREA